MESLEFVDNGCMKQNIRIVPFGSKLYSDIVAARGGLVKWRTP